jgi:hypothetical protein
MTPEDQRPQSSIDIASFSDIFERADSVYVNVSQSIIVTTEDKLRLGLSRYLSRMERRQSWITPFGISLALITTLITTEFRKMGLSRDTWQGIFVAATILVLAWFISSLRHLRDSPTIEEVISELKEGSPTARLSEPVDGSGDRNSPPGSF